MGQALVYYGARLAYSAVLKHDMLPRDTTGEGRVLEDARAHKHRGNKLLLRGHKEARELQARLTSGGVVDDVELGSVETTINMGRAAMRRSRFAELFVEMMRMRTSDTMLQRSVAFYAATHAMEADEHSMPERTARVIEEAIQRLEGQTQAVTLSMSTLERAIMHTDDGRSLVPASSSASDASTRLGLLVAHSAPLSV